MAGFSLLFPALFYNFKQTGFDNISIRIRFLCSYVYPSAYDGLHLQYLQCCSSYGIQGCFSVTSSPEAVIRPATHRNPGQCPLNCREVETWAGCPRRQIQPLSLFGQYRLGRTPVGGVRP